MTPKNAPSGIQNLNGAFLRAKLLAWYQTHERPLPWRVLWKKHKNPWHIWVSEIMLQQTVIKAVLPVYERFLTEFPSPSSLAAANPEDIRLAVRGLGYYRRFDLLHKACVKLSDEKRGLPSAYGDWLALPGVGTYTASAISSITGDEPQGVVDGNVERVLCRLLDIRSEPNLPHLKKKFKEFMDDICALGNPGAINQAVMELGQTICSPSSPLCAKCPVKTQCLAFANSSQTLAPAAKARTKFLDVNLRLEIAASACEVQLLRRPPDAKFLKGTWGFQTWIQSEGANGGCWIIDGSPTKPSSNRALKSIGSIRHSITKHKITAEVVFRTPGKAPGNADAKTVSPRDVERHLVSNLDRKAWSFYLKSQGIQL